MANLNAVLAQLKEERDRINQAIAALEAVVGNHSGRTVSSRKRVLSPAARRRIVAAQKKRWAAFRKQEKKR